MNLEYSGVYNLLGRLLSEQMQKNTTGTTGLITEVSQLSSPYTESNEGSLSGLIDGDTNTFWHSSWSGGNVPKGLHYLQIDFDEEISGAFQLSLTRRDVLNDHLTCAIIVGVKDGVHTHLATVSLPYGGGKETVLANFAFAEGLKTLRIYEYATTTERGYWHAAELQLNKLNMDAAVEAKLVEAYSVYNTLDYVGDVTQEQMDALRAELWRHRISFATSIEAGTYLIAADIDGQLRAAVALDENQTRGDVCAVDATLEEDKVITVGEPQPFSFIAVEGGFLIKDVYGRYVYISGDDNGITVSADIPTEGAVWTVTTNEGGTAYIYNNEKKKLMQYFAQTGNFGFTPAIDGHGLIPTLYSEYASSAPTGITDIIINTTNDFGFTLQGIKATKDTRGIVIRKGTKVMVK